LRAELFAAHFQTAPLPRDKRESDLRPVTSNNQVVIEREGGREHIRGSVFALGSDGRQAAVNGLGGGPDGCEEYH
jgi:hypothetical protein